MALVPRDDFRDLIPAMLQAPHRFDALHVSRTRGRDVGQLRSGRRGNHELRDIQQLIEKHADNLLQDWEAAHGDVG